MTRDRRGQKASQLRSERGTTNKSQPSSRLANGGFGRPPGRPNPHSKEYSDGRILIELSKAQIDQIVRTAGKGGTMSVLLSALEDPEWSLSLESGQHARPVQMDDNRLSRSLLSGLLVLSCFPVDRGYLGIAQIARMLEMNTSTTHRYVATLLAVGLLERDPSTRQYRLAG
jgi:IclR helix-turn-helix domain